jgi:hypothetical protein
VEDELALPGFNWRRLRQAKGPKFEPGHHQRIDSSCDARKSTREAEFSMRGPVPALSTHTGPGLAAGRDGAYLSSVPFTAKTTLKTTAKAV